MNFDRFGCVKRISMIYFKTYFNKFNYVKYIHKILEMYFLNYQNLVWQSWIRAIIDMLFLIIKLILQPWLREPHFYSDLVQFDRLRCIKNIWNAFFSKVKKKFGIIGFVQLITCICLMIKMYFNRFGWVKVIKCIFQWSKCMLTK